MTSELAIIRQHFPSGGAAACKPQVNRTLQAIRLIAWKNDIARDPEALRQIRLANLRRHPFFCPFCDARHEFRVTCCRLCKREIPK